MQLSTHEVVLDIEHSIRERVSERWKTRDCHHHLSLLIFNYYNYDALTIFSFINLLLFEENYCKNLILKKWANERVNLFILDFIAAATFVGVAHLHKILLERVMKLRLFILNVRVNHAFTKKNEKMEKQKQEFLKKLWDKGYFLKNIGMYQK